MKMSCSKVLLWTIFTFALFFETTGEFLISTNKPVTTSSEFPGETGVWEASRAVDGSNSTDPICRCCASTKYETDPSLTLNLERAYEISKIVIYGRTDKEYPGQSFVGLAVYLDDSLILTIPQSGHWINFYKHELPFVQLASTVTLTLPGNDKQLVVCELLVYGDCQTGQYGSDCSEICGQCRDGEPCKKQSGYCSQCSDGFDYADPLCKTRCPSGTYGRNCLEVCGHCRNNQTCDAVAGECISCGDGYTLTDLTCKTRCSSGTYGRNCSKVCGHCRYNQTCDVVAGECTSCEEGFTWTDVTCKTTCPRHTYGLNCTRKCGMCKGETACDKKTGHCPGGCSEMFEGLECLQISSSNRGIFNNSIFSGTVSAIAIGFGFCIMALAVYNFHLRRQRNNRQERDKSNDVSSSPATDTYENLDFNSEVAETNFTK